MGGDDTSPIKVKAPRLPVLSLAGRRQRVVAPALSSIKPFLSRRKGIVVFSSYFLTHRSQVCCQLNPEPRILAEFPCEPSVVALCGIECVGGEGGFRGWSEGVYL